ncbi:unnamed protein product [Rotaria sp. Silwood2]|nr:unnamed protein product [Rotaria sp. Silwood2]CAF4230528.1 unnamed protein product [Rotaria sp. Silwood2]
MAMYNSSAHDNQHDTDITIIKSLLSSDFDNASTSTDIPVPKDSQQAHESFNTTSLTTSNVVYDQNNPTNSDGSRDYICIQHDLQETTKQLEQIINYYRQDLKQESNTQLDCNRNLITRLVDIIRPVYSSNQEKMKDLDTLVVEIVELHDKRFIEQREKNEELYNEISHLKKRMITLENDNNISREIYQIIDSEEWMQIQEETRRLYNLVEMQLNQINELTKLLTQEDKNEKSHTTTCSIPPLTRELQNNIKKKCCMCNHEYPTTSSEVEIHNHIANCLSTVNVDSLNVSVERVELNCPFCDKKLLNNGDTTDLEHLTICCSQFKLTQPHLSINNMFPPINAHPRPPSEDLHGVSSGGVTDIHSASKQQQIRRQQLTTDQQRRSPVRSNSLLITTAKATNRYVTTATAVAVSMSSSLVRSLTFFIYRSSDYSWNDHSNNANVSNQPLRAASPIKAKFSTSARQLANGILHEATNNSNAHPSTSTSPTGHQQNIKDDINNGDLHLSSATKSLRTTRLQRTNSHLDKAPGLNGYGLPMRSESYRSSRLDYGIRSRHTSSKQRTYVNSKTSFHDANGGDIHLNGAPDENTYYQQQQQQQMNMMSSTQRINGSTFDLTANRKLLSPNKSNTFNYPANGTGHHNYYNSAQELHRSETNIDRNNLTRFAARGTASKEQLITAQKFRQTSSILTATTPAAGTTTTTSNTPAFIQPGERHPSAQSYKSRDPNMSYAYTDVKKYIEENDLMSPEKEQIIRNWIVDVEKHRHQLQKID